MVQKTHKLEADCLAKLMIRIIIIIIISLARLSNSQCDSIQTISTYYLKAKTTLIFLARSYNVFYKVVKSDIKSTIVMSHA